MKTSDLRQLIDNFFLAVYEDDLAQTKAILAKGVPVNQHKPLDRYIAYCPFVSFQQFKRLDSELQTHVYRSSTKSVTWTTSALHLAARLVHRDTAKLLLNNGADANITMDGNVTPLMVAVLYQNSPTMEVLLERGANPNAQTTWGKSALHYAVQEGNGWMTRRLLDYGANPNLTSEDGCTALHAAAELGHEDIGLMLLSAGADPSLRTRTGVTALHFALAARSRVLVDAMVKRGEEVRKMLKNEGVNVILFNKLDESARNEAMQIMKEHLPENVLSEWYQTMKNKFTVVKLDFQNIGNILFSPANIRSSNILRCFYEF